MEEYNCYVLSTLTDPFSQDVRVGEIFARLHLEAWLAGIADSVRSKHVFSLPPSYPDLPGPYTGR